ncbi:ABC transporter substrate-binding protein [Liberiplasma polymorphum]|uniref:ABC transporter substrate-binding protein n=1 Tax=Liberiplasma polymorphum TaxID=3374570 RepID=UPI003771D09D
MKRISIIFTMFLTIFIISACTNDSKRDNFDPIELPTEKVELSFWYGRNQTEGQRLEALFESFKNEYPELDVTLTASSGLSLTQGTLRENVMNAMKDDLGPTIMLGSLSDQAYYVDASYILALDDYINHPTIGIDKNDFIQSFIEENKLSGKYYGLPFSKSPEIIVYNKTLFDHYNIVIPTNRAITWNDFEVMTNTLIGNASMKTKYLYSIDYPTHFYLTETNAWDAGFTTLEGNILIGDDNGNTESMLIHIKSMFDNHTLVLPSQEGARIDGSRLLHQGLVAMIQTTTRATRFNIPTQTSVHNGKFDLFEIGFMPAFQSTTCLFDEVSSEKCSVNYIGNNLSINANATEEEQLVAWLFIKHLTNTENSANLGIELGTYPVRYSAIESNAYQTFLNTSYSTSGDNTLYYQAQAAKAAYQQMNYYQHIPVFTGNPDSDKVSHNVSIMITSLQTGDSVEAVIQRFKTNIR